MPPFEIPCCDVTVRKLISNPLKFNNGGKSVRKCSFSILRQSERWNALLKSLCYLFVFFFFYFIFSALLLFLFPWKQGKMSATLLPIKFKWWKIRSWLLVEWGHEFYQHVRIRLPSLSSAALFSTERQFVMFFFCWNIIFFEVPKVKAWRNILFFINILIDNRCSNLTT